MSSSGEAHGTFGAYGIGFVLSVILTVAAFYPVMVPGTVPQSWILPGLTILAVVQIMVHLVFFLHLNASSEQRWNVVAFGFAILVVFILIAGSLWIMHSMSEGMTDPDVPAVPTTGHMSGMSGM
ncbi:cytochrome o ubiquinol oxidase subunit IV [Acetobacteraceae bacterium KSS8]|uniref:Cytochrome bo(3) ubiquinol oxidase subunit 4 n=1 Tax=Endosaccharibacter trunci TaxID=2812733 RepID=A0ABT1W2Y1_9PROT|nr:cytochrome o ubiquinol oxidase subunit IV [Acetobacteraceae bacterium KSS8]